MNGNVNADVYETVPDTDEQPRDCKDCGRLYLLTLGELGFYERAGLAPPKRCKPCRDAKRARNAAQGEVRMRMAPVRRGGI